MLKILALAFILIGVILRFSYSKSINKPKLRKKEIEELEKSKQSATTFIYAGVSVLFLDIMFKIL